MAKKGRSSPWVSTAIAAKSLAVHPSFLLNNRADLFKRGMHWKIKNPTAARPTYLWHLPTLEKWQEGEVDRSGLPRGQTPAADAGQ